jgi:hypothetical protein
MKNLIATILLLAGLSVGAQEYKSRQPTARERERTAGITEYVQDTFQWRGRPVFVTTNLSPVLFLTNRWEGQYFVLATNASLATAFTLALPNPTNNQWRRIEFYGAGAANFFVSNGAGGQLLIASSNTVAPVCLIASNRITSALSTGTNWVIIP